MFLRMRLPLVLALILLACLAAAAQQVVVTGQYEPVPLEESDRSVRALPVAGQSLLFSTWLDFLAVDPSLDLRRRAPGATQADLSIRGAAFGQTLVLLNGMRLNDAQSGHHNLDIPVPLDALSRIEVLHGAGSTLYGSDATGGVVNLIAAPPESRELRLRAALGNDGFNQQRIAWSEAAGSFAHQLILSRDFSSGFLPDRDYRNLSAASLSHWRSTDLVLAHADRAFGADQFYGNFNSWERTRTWFASLARRFGGNTQASFAYRRHTDLFVLYRDRPGLYTNRHAVESFEAAARRTEPLARNLRLHWGLEAIRESIASTNLGDRRRSRGSAYAALDARALGRFSLSLGAREELYRGGAPEFSPTASGGVWLSPHLKLRASASRAFRLPSFTDLYYHDPATLGSPDLRPEQAWSYEGGLDWNAGPRLAGSVAVFERRERDVIDYVRRSPADVWRAANIQRLQMTGIEASVRAAPRRGHLVEASYTALAGAQAALGGLESRYVFNYPSHAASLSWQGELPGGFAARTRAALIQRYKRDPYALWDAALACSRWNLQPFLQLGNITAARYQEIPGVPMPGRTVVLGLEYTTRPH
jgi:iron complex outermembrane receptor protein